ncbi:hypothetical protein HGP16_18650 [Rhizobium sp. P40RR-XXII]|uniref:hypothetical protein n=1 Tax=Rhizobium sp. P40RR-XXII TaxID=2726739 RepID=UPI001456D323|nr:hypothetical protein [Rhizobium sp. P40RR-XXII]NLS18580.1 hypothetical protein [Rhizobium sp. P40RR-XXII]
MKQSIIKRTNKALQTRIVAGIGGVLAGVLSLGLSIYETRTGTEVSHVAAGASIDSGQWKVTLNSANLAAQTPDGLRTSNGKKALTIDLMLENLTAESSNLYRDTIKLDNIPNAPMPQFYLVRDREQLWDLQPMMPETVQAVWELPATQALPKVLKVTVVGTTYKPKDNLYAAPGWFNPTNIARVDLPVVTAPEGAAP